MRVLLAPDKFKGCLTAAEVAAAVAAGITDARPDVETILVPVADGGDGTVAAAVGAGYRADHRAGDRADRGAGHGRRTRSTGTGPWSSWPRWSAWIGCPAGSWTRSAPRPTDWAW